MRSPDSPDHSYDYRLNWSPLGPIIMITNINYAQFPTLCPYAFHATVGVPATTAATVKLRGFRFRGDCPGRANASGAQYDPQCPTKCPNTAEADCLVSKLLELLVISQLPCDFCY